MLRARLIPAPLAIRAALLAGLLALACPAFAGAQADSAGARYRVSVGEPRVRGAQPQLHLMLSTVREFPCVGYSIRTASRQRGDTLWVDLLGIQSPPGDLCLTAMGAADGGLPLGLPHGRYSVRVRSGGQEDRMALEITASSARLVPGRTRFVEVDTARVHLHPPRSFAFTCNLYEGTRMLCANVADWIGAQRGIRRITLPRAGRTPFQREGRGEFVRFFQYDNDAALERIRVCMARMEPHIREAVGVNLGVETWTGDRFSAWSRRSYHEPHIPPPADVAARACGASAARG